MDARRAPDVHSLAGAYVLDAVPDVERGAFGHHLGRCSACAEEVAGLREALTRLGLAASAQPRPGLKPVLLARIAQVRQLPPEGGASVAELRRFAGSRAALRLSSAAAAVLLVTTTVLGVLLVRDRQALEDTRLRAGTVISVLRAGDTRATGVSADTGTGRMTVVVSRSQDRLLLLADGLTELPGGSDFQAWKMREGAVESAGLLMLQGGRVALEVSGIGATERIGVTVEPEGGSLRPTTPPVMVADLP